MITIAQCRAARGLLGWTQQDLAKACGMSKTAINNFEKGNSHIKSESLLGVEKAFEKAGILFGINDSIAKRQDKSEILNSPLALAELLQDILSSLHDGDEILCLNAEIRKTLPMEEGHLKNFLQEIQRRKIKTRIITSSQDKAPLFEPNSCEKKCPLASDTPPEAMVSEILYAGKIAYFSWNSSAITLVESKSIYSCEKKRFESLWIKGKPSNKKTTPQTNSKTAV